MTSKASAVFTIGHSTHPIAEFVEILLAFGIELLVDVRTIPKSRKNPQFNKETLPEFLKIVGIRYQHWKNLGGLRHPVSDSKNMGWENSSFRGYADYMQTESFSDALEKLIQLSSKHRIAVMCAEAVPWRCHRSLIADALVTRGIPAIHMMSRTQSYEHKLNPMAKIRGENVVYPAN